MLGLRVAVFQRGRIFQKKGGSGQHENQEKLSFFIKNFLGVTRLQRPLLLQREYQIFVQAYLHIPHEPLLLQSLLWSLKRCMPQPMRVAWRDLDAWPECPSCSGELKPAIIGIPGDPFRF